MDYELVKELQDAGYPVTTPNVPDLSELITACGDQFLGLEKTGELWFASSEEDGNMPVGSKGKTPEEAVARLWLAFNKK
jgi:hypothetical protein